MQKLFGGPPGAVIARLGVISIIVGVILTSIGIHPYDIVNSLSRLVIRIYDMGFDAVAWLFTYLWLGALVVVPIWAVARIYSAVVRSGDNDAPGGKAGYSPGNHGTGARSSQ
ncbi:MAG: DUF6460 domain-containing protein [Alphaproteobacteria bacterium]